jgi:hypothetical protein
MNESGNKNEGYVSCELKEYTENYHQVRILIITGR